MKTFDRLRKQMVATLVLAAGLCTSRAAWGDVVVMVDGNRLEGMVTTSTLMPNVILFSDHVNKSLQIPRNKVQTIIREPEEASRLRIARVLAREGKYEQALEQLREAKRVAPGDLAVQEEEKNVLRALAIQTSKKTELKADEARGLVDKIKQAMEGGQYEKASPWFAMLENDSVPADVRDAAARLKVQFYDQWGDYRADKLDPLGAMECYEKVMDLDPNAKETYTKLMRLYERASQPGADAAQTRKLQEFLQAKVLEDPKDLNSRLRLGNLLYMKKDWDGALEQYLALYQDNASSLSKDLPYTRVDARLRALLDGRHRRSAERHEYDLAIQQFREYQSIFPDVDSQPQAVYEYYKRAEQLGPQDDAARLELADFCEKAGLEEPARKEVMTVLRNNPSNPAALRVLARWAQNDLAEVRSTFGAGLFAQIAGLVSQMHERYPTDRYPSLQPILDEADDYIERARNELRVQRQDNSQRALELADAGDQNFDRAMAALESYRNGSDVAPRGFGDTRLPGYGVSGTVTRSVGSYKADAIMYFERALRCYREAQALDASLADAAKKDTRRKIADCERYLNLLKNQRLPRRQAGPGSSRRFRPQYPAPPGYYSPYGYPYVTPVQPFWPYGVQPYPYGYPYPYPNPYYNPYPTPTPTPSPKPPTLK